MTDQDSGVLADLAEEFTQRLHRGEQPDVEEYARRHPELAARIRALLPALLLIEGVAQATTSAGSPLLGASVGPYRIEREIGRGGMGSVYAAVHVALCKRVALKVRPLRLRESEEASLRFVREAHIAAGLHHTSIVPVFDVGEADGLAYYAMELIDGRSLDRILVDVRASREERWSALLGGARLDGELAPREGASRPAGKLPTAKDVLAYFRAVAVLGVQAADALQHAHERGVTHRDIKPSNLLVDGRGALWITDFGLARRSEDHSLTMTGALVGTPRYMSPEQAVAGQPVDHRTDVYSLGATLYELLARQPVFAGDTPGEVVAQIQTKEPVPLRRHDAAVPRDLEIIVAKAMAKRRDDRYASAGELAADLRRWLACEPIVARGAGPLLRWRRWAQRNPALASATAGLFLALAAGLVVSVLLLEQARRARAQAERSFADAVAAVDAMLTDVSQEDLQYVPHADLLRAQLLRKALQFHRGFLAQRADDPAVRREVASALARVAAIESELGETAAAERDLREAIARFTAEGKDAAGVRSALAEAHGELAQQLLLRGRMAEAEAECEASLRLLEGVDPASAGGTGVARTLIRLGSVCASVSRADAARAAFERALAALAQSTVVPGEETMLARLAASCHHRLGELRRSAGELEPAEAEHRRALQLRQEVMEREPRAFLHGFELAGSWEALGAVLAARGDASGARAAYEQAIGRYEELVAAHPDVPRSRGALANACNQIGMLAVQEHADGETWFRRALALWEDLAAEVDGYTTVVAYQKSGAGILNNLGVVLRRPETLAESLRCCERAIACELAVLAANPADPEAVRSLADHRWNLVLTQLAGDDHAAAANGAAELCVAPGADGKCAWRAASGLARCAALAEADARLDPAGRAALAQDYAERAMGSLRTAVQRGYWHRPSLAHEFFVPLRRRQDFRDLARELEERDAAALR